MHKVLVIVVVYNGMAWLERCLGSVADEDIFVVDNDSTDGSADWIQAHYPKAKLVRSAENLGFAKANNMGMEYALLRGYDYVYLLNQDAWLEEGAMEKLIAASEADASYAVLSPLQMTAGYKDYDLQFGKLYKDGKKTVRRIMAAHWLVPTAAIRKLGLFCQEFFPMYGQDDDWCNRARYHGYRIGIVPEARAVHDRADRTESKERIMDRNYRVGSLVRLCDINRPLWERFLFVCLFTVVKAFKYGSLVPFRHFGWLCRQLSRICKIRAKYVSLQDLTI